MRNRNVAVIIPLYNESAVIGQVIEDVSKHFKNIICVDDGSTDYSAQQVDPARAKLVSHPLNLGQGAALQTGIEYALLDKDIQYFVTYDADGQHDINDVLSMLSLIERKGVDIVLGSRFMGKTSNIGRLKYAVLKCAVVFSNATSGLRLTDTHNGLRVFNRDVASKLNITMSDFSHASEILERIHKENFSYTEMPVTISYTDYSRSKGQSITNIVSIGFDVLLNRIVQR